VPSLIGWSKTISSQANHIWVIDGGVARQSSRKVDIFDKFHAGVTCSRVFVVLPVTTCAKRNRKPQIKMPHRAVSPAASENDFDITSALFHDGGDDDADFPTTSSKDLGALDAGEILDLESDDGDEAFIAAQQAASNRKNANVKGKSVKKGGGFQAMGAFECKKMCTYQTDKQCRLECSLTKGHRTKRIHGTNSHSAKNDSLGSRWTRCSRNGKNWFWKNCRFRDSYD